MCVAHFTSRVRKGGVLRSNQNLNTVSGNMVMPCVFRQKICMRNVMEYTQMNGECYVGHLVCELECSPLACRWTPWKPFPNVQTIAWANVYLPTIRSSGIHMMTSQEIHDISFTKMCVQFTLSNACPYLPGSNELTNDIVYIKFTLKSRQPAVRSHDDIIKWKHFPHYRSGVWGIHQSPVDSPHKGQWCGALMFSLICTWINSWANNRDTRDLRCHRAPCDITVMWTVGHHVCGQYCQKHFLELKCCDWNCKDMCSLSQWQSTPSHYWNQWWPSLLTHIHHQGPLLLTWFNFNPSMDK